MRYNPAVHILCDAPGCTAIEKRWPVTVQGIQKAVCLTCLHRLTDTEGSAWILTQEDKAMLAAHEMRTDDAD